MQRASTEPPGIDKMEQNIQNHNSPLYSTPGLNACTPASVIISKAKGPPQLQSLIQTDKVQAWLKPLTGAELLQMLLRIAVGETVRTVGEIHEDERIAFQAEGTNNGRSADKQQPSVYPHWD